ncbi:MAG: aspartate/glutamate racemase family protein [Chloroflexota bacterium]
MYGWKARIGLILPSPNVVMEPEFNALKPEGVSIHASRLLFTAPTRAHYEHMSEEVEESAELLATAGVNTIAYGCTMGSLFLGAGYDQDIIQRIENQTRIPTTTTATAVLRAFQELKITRVAVATPYGEESDRLEREFLEASGIRVVNMKGINLGIIGLRHAPPETYYSLAAEVDVPEAEAVFISCTAARTVTIIEALEQKLGKYVISSNTATFWDVMRRLGIGAAKIRGYGRLLETI